MRLLLQKAVKLVSGLRDKNTDFLLAFSTPVGVRSIVISVFVCLFVCSLISKPIHPNFPTV